MSHVKHSKQPKTQTEPLTLFYYVWFYDKRRKSALKVETKAFAFNRSLCKIDRFDSEAVNDIIS